MKVRQSRKPNRYTRLIDRLFQANYTPGAIQVPFTRSDIEPIAKKLKIDLPKNLGDIVYSFRYRSDLPKSITSKAPTGKSWVIRPAGKAKYSFEAVGVSEFKPRVDLSAVKVPDSTPGLIELYALSDEQALLAKLRYNRLIDIFTGVTCYSLQSHLRTSVPEMGQVETDELYVGLDQAGVHYVIPVQAKGGKDKLGSVQVEQDIALCRHKFPNLVCRSIGAQFMGEKIALFEFVNSAEGIAIASERHYALVDPQSLSAEELIEYKSRLA